MHDTSIKQHMSIYKISRSFTISKTVFSSRVRYSTTHPEQKNSSHLNKAFNKNKFKIYSRTCRTGFVVGYGTKNIDQRLVWFHLVAGTCPTNSSHAGTSINWGDTSLQIVPRIQKWFEIVGQVAGTKFWSLRLDSLVKMGGSHERTWSPGLAAGLRLVPPCVPTLKALGLRPCTFISFLVFGNPDETHGHVHEILLDICCFSRSLDYVVWKEKKNIICGIIYRQHNSPESFQSYLDEVLERISSNDKIVHIMGDFNLSLFNVETFCKFTKDFLLS